MGNSSKKLGAGFWIIVLVAAVLDMSDVFSQTLGALFSFSVVFSPLGFLLEFFSWGVDLVFGSIIAMYLFVGGVRPSTRNIATIVISMFIEFIPLLGILPMETIMLFVIRYYHNKEAEKVTKKEVESVGQRKTALVGA